MQKAGANLFPRCLLCELGLGGPVVLQLVWQADVESSPSNHNRGSKPLVFVSDFGENS